MEYVNMIISYKTFKDSWTNYQGKRRITASIEYEADEPQIENSGEVGAAIAEQTDNARRLTYSNFKDNLNLTEFISLAIEYTLKDAIENHSPGLFLNVELPKDVQITQKVTDWLGAYYSVDPLFKGLAFTKAGEESDEKEDNSA